MIMTRTYTEMMKLKTFSERYKYLKLNGIVGNETFGSDRHMNQSFYTSRRWRETRDIVIIRDGACDLGIDNMEIHDRLIVHHMNPMTLQDVENDSDVLYDPEFLICTSDKTHNAIHYGDDNHLGMEYTPRTPHDTTPWK